MATARPRVRFVRSMGYLVGRCLECREQFSGADATKEVRAHCRDNPGHLVAATQITRTDYWAE